MITAPLGKEADVGGIRKHDVDSLPAIMNLPFFVGLDQ
jgi:hypothetical protein